jgi:nitrogen fixation NifU-like protein
MNMDSVHELYRDVILDHYRNPRGAGTIENPDAHHEGYNPLCGDHVELVLKFAGNRISKVCLHGKGCSISVASGSMMSELVENKTPEEAEALAGAFKNMMHGKPAPEGMDIGDLDALEGVRKFPVRVKCALLPWETLREALRAWGAGKASPEKSSTTE